MRILTVNSLYPPTVVGGAELGVGQICRGLSAAGHDVAVVTLDAPGARLAEKDFADGVHVHRLPLANLYWPWDPESKPDTRVRRLGWHLLDTANPFMAQRLVQIAHELSPDVVLTQNLQGFSTLVIPKLISAGFPVVHVVHDFSLLCPRTALYRDGQRCGLASERCVDCKLLTAPRARHLRGLCGVIGVSQAVLDAHLQSGLFLTTPAAVVHNALRDDMVLASEPRRAQPGPVTFGFMGRVDRPKGIESLLQAMALLGERGYQATLKVAGRGEPGYVRDIRSRWPLPEVDYVGFANPSEFYRSVDVAVFPSESYEALGNVVFEAYSQGLPVVATDCGGPAETVEPDRTGYLVPPGDPVALADRMAQMCDEPQKRTDMSGEALKRAAVFRLSRRVGEYVAAISGFMRLAA